MLTDFHSDNIIITNKIHLTRRVYMKVLMINGSPRVGGNTAVALAEMEKTFFKIFGLMFAAMLIFGLIAFIILQFTG